MGLCPGGPLALAGWPISDDVVVDVIHLAGGRSKRFAVLDVGLDPDARLGAEVVRRFGRYGAESFVVCPVTSRNAAMAAGWGPRLHEFDAIIVSGCDTRSVLEILADTPCHQALVERWQMGRIVVGIGAGAGALCRWTVAGSDGFDRLMGLGLARNLILAGPAEWGPLLQALGDEPPQSACLGLCLEAKTGVVLRDSEFVVAGEAGVYVFDGRDRTVPPAAAGVMPWSRSVAGIKLHLLGPGYRFNLRTRAIVTDADAATPAAAG